MVRRKTEVLERRARTEFSASNANSLKAGPQLKLSWEWPPPRGLSELRVFIQYRWGPSQRPLKGIARASEGMNPQNPQKLSLSA